MVAERARISAKIRQPTPNQLKLGSLKAVREATQTHERFKRENEVIPVASLVLNDGSFIVDEPHVVELMGKIAEDGQQLIPILVAAREENGNAVYDLIDGAHRSEALIRMHSKTIKANVIYG